MVAAALVDGEEIVVNERGAMQSRLDARYDLIDPRAMEALAVVLGYGITRYPDPNNWRRIDEADHLNHALAHIYHRLDEIAGRRSEMAHLHDDDLAHAFCRLMFALGVRAQNHDGCA